MKLIVLGTVTSLVSSYIVYGVLGKRYFDADDDYWEFIRKKVISFIDDRTDLFYTESVVPSESKVGLVRMDPDVYEERLEDAGYYRVLLSSMHRSPSGWREDGSWSRTYGVMFKASSVLDKIPVVGEYLRKFCRASDRITALRQVHEIHFVEYCGDVPVIHVYGHDEYNPANPFVTVLHYHGDTTKPASGMVAEDLNAVGVRFS